MAIIGFNMDILARQLPKLLLYKTPEATGNQGFGD